MGLIPPERPRTVLQRFGMALYFAGLLLAALIGSSCAVLVR